MASFIPAFVECQALIRAPPKKTQLPSPVSLGGGGVLNNRRQRRKAEMNGLGGRWHCQGRQERLRGPGRAAQGCVSGGVDAAAEDAEYRRRTGSLAR